MKIINGDCLDELKKLEENSIDSIVTDPPYGLSFMGKAWDNSVPSKEVWEECLRVLKPGGHLLSFAGTRTQHRMAVRIEDAGFEIRDMIAWVYGSGFPKSHNIGKAVDKLQGNERDEYIDEDFLKRNPNKLQYDESINNGFKDGKEASIRTRGNSPYEGWGTALKPALEPITVARKPFKGTVAENVLKYGTGGINIDGCRVEGKLDGDPNRFAKTDGGWVMSKLHEQPVVRSEGRFPANLIHDGSDEVVELLGDANRFFYCAKASKTDRNEGLEGFKEKRGGSMQANIADKMQLGGASLKGEHKEIQKTKNNHPTVKPTKLMQYLVRLVTPKGGVVLDPFMGSGSTGKACKLEGFDFIGIELDPEYCKIAEARIDAVEKETTTKEDR